MQQRGTDDSQSPRFKRLKKHELTGKNYKEKRSPRLNDDLNRDSVMAYKSESYKLSEEKILRMSEMNVINSFEDTANSRVKSLLGDMAREIYHLQSQPTEEANRSRISQMNLSVPKPESEVEIQPATTYFKHMPASLYRSSKYA